MSFFTKIRNLGEKAVGAAAGFVVGGPVGAAAGAAAVGGVQGDRGLALLGDAVAGYTGATGFQAASGAASAASAAGTAAGGVGPVVTSFSGQAQVFGNALLSGVESSPIGTAVSAASNLLGSSGVQTGLKVASTGVAAASLLGAGAASANKGAVAGPGLPANDPAAVADANAAADQVRRRSNTGSAGTILTSPLGLNTTGKSASSLLLG